MSTRQHLPLLCSFLFASALLAQDLSTTTEYTVRDDHGGEVWTELSLTSEVPVLVDQVNRVVYAHPSTEGVVDFRWCDVTTIHENYRHDSVLFLSQEYAGPVSISLADNATLTGTLNYSYESYAGWYNYTLQSSIHIQEPGLRLETTGPGGPVVLFWKEISAVTPNFDYLQNNYHFNLGTGVGDDRLFSAGLPVRMTFIGGTSQPIVLFDAGWQTTDENGNVTFGLGDQDVYIQATGPTEHILYTVQPIDPQTSQASWAYLPYSGKVDGDCRFFEGTLCVAVKDACGNPVQARVRVTGGPVYGTSRTELYTDAAGHAEFVYGDADAGWQLAEVKILPALNLGAQVTQVVDGPDKIIKSRPFFLNGTVQLLSNAYSFKSGDTISDVELKLFRQDASIDTESFTVKHTYTDDDRRKGLDRYKFSIPAQKQLTRYRVEAYLPDTDGKQALVGSVWRDVAVTAKPIGDRTLQFQYVPLEPQMTVPDTSWLEECVKRVLPVKVAYTTAGPLKPDLWPWEGDIYRLSGWYRELEKYRISQNPAPDLVIGVVPPGSLTTWYSGSAAGLSMDGYRHVVLLDLTRTKSHHLIHEYLHTLGLPDNYGGALPPPSAPGYNDQGHRIWNAPNKSALHCAIMYDFAPVGWPTGGEYSTMLSMLTESVEPLVAWSSPLFNSTAPPTPPKVVLVSGLIEDTAYGSMITRRSPIFIDEGSIWAPQEVAPGHFEASGARLLANGQEVAKAYTSNNMTLNSGSAEFGGVLGMVTFALPWQSGVDTVEFCRFTSDGYAFETMYDSTVVFSEHEPDVQWTAAPQVGATLSGKVEFAFEASDLDADDSLWAWPRVSTDGGQSWQPVGNYFAVQPGGNAFTVDCSQWPDSTDCRVKLLVSDDGNTAVVQAGPYMLDGFDPNPSIQCSPTAFEHALTVDEPVIVPLIIRNKGRAALDVQVQTNSLPDWLKPESGESASILPAGEQTLFFIAEPNIPETYTARIDLTTNDPVRPTVSIPLELQYHDQPVAPDVVWVGTLTGISDGDAVSIPSSITVLARDAAGSDERAAWVTAMKVSGALECIADRVPMENTDLPGMYARTIDLPQSLAGESLAFEFEMQDPATGLMDGDGLRSRAYDFSVDLIRPNSAPRFTELVPHLDEYDYIYTGFGQSLDLSWTLEEPDSDFVYYMVHSPLPFELDPQARTLHCIIPLIDDPYRHEVTDQTVELIAVDRFGAQTKASWQLYLSPYNRINHRAYPYYSSTTIDADTVDLKAFSFSALEGQYCRIEGRPPGSQTWTLIGQSDYDQEHPGIYADGRMAVIPWDTSALAPGQAWEVRFVDYWPGGGPDSDPPTIVFRKALTAGRIVRITAPAQIAVGRPFDLVIEVQNQSAHTWNLSDGYHLASPAGADPLTGLAAIRPTVDFAQVPPDSTTVFHARVTAAQPGLYTTTWRLTGPDGPIGQPLSAEVEVASEWSPPMPGDIDGDKTVGLADLGALSAAWGCTPKDTLWNPACDLQPDSVIDLFDLIQVAHYWLESY